MNLNIFFTLLVSLLAMWGLYSKKWWIFIAMVLVASFVNIDYSVNGIIIMAIFYFFRNRPSAGACLYVLFWIPALWGGQIEDPKSLIIAGHAIDWTIFGAFAAIPIFLKTNTGIKIPKWFFYGFYPAHLAAIGIARLILKF